MSLSRPQFPCLYYAKVYRQGNWIWPQFLGLEVPVRLGEQTGPSLQRWGSETGVGARGNAPFPLPLAREGWEQGGRTDGFPAEPQPAGLRVPKGSGSWRGRGRVLTQAAGTRCSTTPAASGCCSVAPAELRPAQVLTSPGPRATTHSYPSPLADTASASAQTSQQPQAAGGRPPSRPRAAGLCLFGLHPPIFPFSFLPALKEASFLRFHSERSLASGKKERAFPPDRRPFCGSVYLSGSEIEGIFQVPGPKSGLLGADEQRRFPFSLGHRAAPSSAVFSLVSALLAGGCVSTCSPQKLLRRLMLFRKGS